MRLRGLIVSGLLVVGLGTSAIFALPLLGDRAARHIEDRLQQETGREWRIGEADIQFRPTPKLVLRNVALGDGKADAGKVAATFREIRLADPFSLAFGSTTSGHAVVEGVSASVPLNAPSRSAKPDGAPAAGKSDTGLALTAAIRGADLKLTDDKRTIAAKAQAVEVDFDLSGPRDKQTIRASVELPAYQATVALDLPKNAGAETTAPFSLKVEPRGGGQAIEAKAQASLHSAAFRLDSLTGTIGREPFTGNFEVSWVGGRPRAWLDLELDALTLTDRQDAPTLEAVPQQGLVVAVDPTMIPDPRWFADFDGKGTIAVSRLMIGSVRFDKVDFAANVKSGGLDAALSAGSVYGGGLRGRYVVAPGAEGAGDAQHEFSLSLNRVRVLPLLTDLAKAGGVDGTGSMRVALRATGNAVDTVRRSVSGNAEVSVTEGRINGLDLAGSIGGGLIPADVVRRGNALGTRLDQLSASFALTEGQATTNDLLIRTGLMEAKGIGSIDLIDRQLDIRLKPQVLAANGRPSSGKLDVPITISGPWEKPAVSADMSGLMNNPAGAIQSLKDLSSGVLGENGDNGGLGGLLDSFMSGGGRGARERRR